jgi:hypothetical protein
VKAKSAQMAMEEAQNPRLSTYIGPPPDEIKSLVADTVGLTPRSRAPWVMPISVVRTNPTASARNSSLYFDGRPTRDTPFLA